VSTETSLALTPQDFEPRNLDQAMKLADQLSKSALVPDAIRGKPADILLIMMKGREFGLTVNQAFTHLNVIKGKVGMSADMMVALCRTRCPDFVRFECIETTAEKATFEAERRGQKPERLTFTIKDAQQAGLVSDGGMYRKYPAQMLRARCQSGLARLLFQDVVAGLYDPDELRSPQQRESTPPLPASIPALPQPEAMLERVESMPPEPPPPHDPVTGEIPFDDEPKSAAEDDVTPDMDERDYHTAKVRNAKSRSEALGAMAKAPTHLKAQLGLVWNEKWGKGTHR
jgi:hypothetical protein